VKGGRRATHTCRGRFGSCGRTAILVELPLLGRVSSEHTSAVHTQHKSTVRVRPERNTSDIPPYTLSLPMHTHTLTHVHPPHTDAECAHTAWPTGQKERRERRVPGPTQKEKKRPRTKKKHNFGRCQWRVACEKRKRGEIPTPW
jgi:hypothetical protein